MMSLLLLPSLRRVGFTWRWSLDLEDAGFRRIGRLAGWAFVYVAVNLLIDVCYRLLNPAVRNP